MIRVLGASAACATLLGLVVACGSASVEPNDVSLAGPAGSAAGHGAGERHAAPPATEAISEAARAKAALWEEEHVVEALAKDCRWDPDGCLRAASKVTHVQENGRYGDLSEACHDLLPLACVAIPSQGCNPNPCSQEDGCFAGCRGTCNDCHATCASSCDTCKSTCKDDACRLACAKTCGACRGACVAKLDHCTTAGCAAEAKQCYRDQAAAYAASTCEKVCPSVQACVAKCPGAPGEGFAWFEEPCPASCFDRLGVGCPELFEPSCVGNGTRLIIMMSEEDRRGTGD